MFQFILVKPLSGIVQVSDEQTYTLQTVVCSTPADRYGWKHVSKCRQELINAGTKIPAHMNHSIITQTKYPSAVRHQYQPNVDPVIIIIILYPL